MNKEELLELLKQKDPTLLKEELISFIEEEVKEDEIRNLQYPTGSIGIPYKKPQGYIVEDVMFYIS